jgi:hypothetical protein
VSDVEPVRIKVFPVEHETFGNSTAVQVAAERVKDKSSLDGEEGEGVHVYMAPRGAALLSRVTD